MQADTLSQPSVEAITSLFPEMFHLIATTQSKIQSVGDLQEKCIALMPEGSGS